MKSGWQKRISEGLQPLHCYENAPMSAWTTFKVGGPADLLVEPVDAEQFTLLMQRARAEQVPVQVIGGGSNIVVRDGGIIGLVIVLGDRMAEAHVEPNGDVLASSGVRLVALARLAAEMGLSGLEFASGIPGTLGGGIVMNAGAYGGEMQQVTHRVQILDEQDQLRWLSHDEMAFGYRESIVQQHPWWIVAAELRLASGIPEEIKDKMAELAIARRSKQPLQYPSAGSAFKRPPGHYAGQLIESAGLKGYRVGGAQISELHAGFIINTGGATANDILCLIYEVQQRVFERHGVHIEPEVRVIGVERR